MVKLTGLEILAEACLVVLDTEGSSFVEGIVLYLLKLYKKFAYDISKWTNLL